MERPGVRIKTANDWSGLFSIPRTLEGSSSSTLNNGSSSRSAIYSRYDSSDRLGSSTPPPSSSSRLRSYARSSATASAATSDYSSAYISRTYNRQRPFVSRFLKRSQPDSDADDDDDNSQVNSAAGGENNRTQRRAASDQSAADNETERKVRYHQQGTVLNDGTVIRLRREVSTSEDDDQTANPIESSEPESEAEEDTVEPEPEPEPEDPLEKEERELNHQLMLSLCLTLTDEENIRQRLLEIKKSRLRKNQQKLAQNLVQRFSNDADVTLFENQQSPARQEEERILMHKYALIHPLTILSFLADAHRLSTELPEVEQKDIQVRLQELFRDKKNILEGGLRSIEATYDHILQETSTELNELETSITNKTELVQKLQDEILDMTVRKEVLSKAMEDINKDHQDKVNGITESIKEVDAKVTDYSVCIVPAPPEETNSKPKINSYTMSEELREIEQELECPVCMEISRPPIYQCEEGHIICSNCKPLLTDCPHNCGKKYAEPAIRCRFAEKLSHKYAAQLSKQIGKK